MKKDLILSQLVSKREENIKSLFSWPDADFIEMEETYNQAKKIALASEDSDAVAILEEKISQLKEAFSLKKQSQAANS